MRRLSLLLLTLLAGHAFAINASEKNTSVNTRYRESAQEKARREFQETETELPSLPDADSGDWFELYVSEQYTKKPKILLSSLQIMPAPDTSIRYILNIESSQGYDNLTAEGIFCARSSFEYAGDKRSSYKVFGYGDPINKRWIQPRNNDWKLLNTTLNRDDNPRSELYQAFCVDGTPKTVEGLIQRLRERSGRYSPSLSNPLK